MKAVAFIIKMLRLSTAMTIGITFLVCYASSLETNTTTRRCHWCGPLAEQIHRSRRATPCDPKILDTQITDCEPGYNYCAIVASSPPFIESRYCIKTYLDECYSLYCSTTDSWKTICPCREDLCNSNNTEREEDAFESLKMLTSTTVPPKKRTSKRSKIIKRDINDVTTIVPDAREDINPPCDELGHLDETIQSTVITNSENEIIETKECEANNKPIIETTTPNSAAENHIEDALEPIIELKETKKATSEPTESAPPSEIEIKPTMTLQIENQISEDRQAEISNEEKPSAESPTAEALQDGDTPLVNIEKSTEHSTTESATMSSFKELNATASSRKNIAPVIAQNLYLIVLGVISFVLL